MSKHTEQCDHCKGTGFYGDRGAGVACNGEYQICDCCKVGAAIQLHEQRTCSPIRQERAEMLSMLERVQALLDAVTNVDYHRDPHLVERLMTKYENETEDELNALIERAKGEG